MIDKIGEIALSNSFQVGLILLAMIVALIGNILKYKDEKEYLEEYKDRIYYRIKTVIDISVLRKATQISILLIGASIMSVAASTIYAFVDISIASIPIEISIRSIVPILAILIIVLCIVLAIYYSPRKLKLATGATLGFLFAAYVYDGWIFVKETLESFATEESVDDE